MIFIKFRNLVILALLAAASAVGSGAYAYRLLLSAGQKYQAERVLLVSLAGGIVILVVLFRLLRSSRKNLGRIEKIVDLARNTGVVSEERLAAFGPLGKNLALLYREIGEVSERRADRIFLLRGLVEGLLDFIEEPLAVVDSAGNIVFEGPKFAETGERAEAAPAGRSLAEVFPGLDFAAVLFDADKTLDPVETAAAGQKFAFYPLRDRTGTVAYLILTAGGKRPSLMERLNVRREGEPGKTVVRKANSLFSRLKSTFGGE